MQSRIPNDSNYVITLHFTSFHQTVPTCETFFAYFSSLKTIQIEEQAKNFVGNRKNKPIEIRVRTGE